MYISYQDTQAFYNLCNGTYNDCNTTAHQLLYKPKSGICKCYIPVSPAFTIRMHG